ncbi:hypothetical protein CKO_03159 [Citrobacter koseri ATCC BAA-895]|uniref:Uncharacterized protein n=1 Tax=Citrobacter koseri (strain ATCC BAA-895 / CDC 4225-83 / SGSC4696) TaxID=290338 RepID=A8AL85_CITK8|nr:hypothetical protein CKO_03159 [Citrobacter koseri ATCC BAA-895]
MRPGAAGWRCEHLIRQTCAARVLSSQPTQNKCSDLWYIIDI